MQRPADDTAGQRPKGRPPAPEKPEIRERGMSRGQPQFSDTRLFMQLQAFGDCTDTAAVIDAVAKADIKAVVYEDVNDPRGIAVLTIADDPIAFATTARSLFNSAAFANLTHKPQFTMLGRTYTIGYEPDLNEALFARPTRTALNPEWPWVIWYPLRRSGKFVNLSSDEQSSILMEHGTIGRAFGEADFAHDIRLACHGLDQDDNDFVIGLTGKELHPLSAIVQRMRLTTQTSQYLEKLGPFFVGRVVWQSAND